MKPKLIFQKFTLEVEDPKAHVYLLLEVDNFPIYLIDEFQRFHAEKTQKDKIFRALPLMREWLRSRGHSAKITPNPEKPFYIRWWSAAVLNALEYKWQKSGLKIFGNDFKW